MISMSSITRIAPNMSIGLETRELGSAFGNTDPSESMDVMQCRVAIYIATLHLFYRGNYLIPIRPTIRSAVVTIRSTIAVRSAVVSVWISTIISVRSVISRVSSIIRITIENAYGYTASIVITRIRSKTYSASARPKRKRYKCPGRCRKEY